MDKSTKDIILILALIGAILYLIYVLIICFIYTRNNCRIQALHERSLHEPLNNSLISDTIITPLTYETPLTPYETPLTPYETPLTPYEDPQ